MSKQEESHLCGVKVSRFAVIIHKRRVRSSLDEKIKDLLENKNGYH